MQGIIDLLHWFAFILIIISILFPNVLARQKKLERKKLKQTRKKKTKTLKKLKELRKTQKPKKPKLRESGFWDLEKPKNPKT